MKANASLAQWNGIQPVVLVCLRTLQECGRDPTEGCSGETPSLASRGAADAGK
jgi:hypothetical protein